MLVRQPVITNQRAGDGRMVPANRWMRGLKRTTLLSMPPVPMFDEFSVQKLRESHETIQRLTSQVQELQERMNYLNDSGEFEEVESN